MDTLSSLYETYLKQVRTAAAAMRPGDGLFGMGRKLSDDPCHDAFLHTMEQYLEMAALQEPPERINQILGFVYRASITYQDADLSAYWVLQAVHGLTLPLISRLDREDAAALGVWYASVFSRSERLPVQNQVLKALQAQARVSSKGFFSFLK